MPGRVPVSDLAALTNTDYFFIYSDGCEAGWFDGKDCVAEAFTTGSAYGAFAVIMNARTGWAMGRVATTAARFHRWFWDAIFNPDPHPALAYRTRMPPPISTLKKKLIPYFTDVAMAIPLTNLTTLAIRAWSYVCRERRTRVLEECRKERSDAC